MPTTLRNLCRAPSIRGYGAVGRWTSAPAQYALSQATDDTCPEGGDQVAVSTQIAAAAIGNVVFGTGATPALRAPVDPTQPVSASMWFKRVNDLSWPQWRLLLLCQKADGSTTTTTTLFTPLSNVPVGVWTQIWAEGKAIVAQDTATAYLGLYPVGAVLGQVGGVVYGNAAVLLQRPVLGPDRRFFDGDTTTWAPDTVCTWDGPPGASESTWTSKRDQVGTFTTWDGAAEHPLAASSRWDGAVEIPETYVEAQVV